MAIVLKAEKKGLVVTLTTDRKPITYNMSTHEFTSYTGRKVQSFPRYVNPSDSLTHIERLILHAVECSSQWSCAYLDNLELWLGQPELLENVHMYDLGYLSTKCPKGFVKWLKEKGEKPLIGAYERFMQEQVFDKLPQDDKDFIDILTNTRLAPYCNGSVGWFKSLYIGFNTKQRDALKKMFKVSTKSLCFNLSDDIRTFINYISHNMNYNRLSCCENWEEKIDTNRDYNTNLQTLFLLADKEQEKSIIATEDKGRTITELSNDEFVIVVPSSLEDLTDEGRQQNNCVGHFYNNSISDGIDFVYFIRKKDTPDKSYITNRFNIYSRKTVETRKKNNAGNDDNNARDLIKLIDDKLRELLYEKKA